MSDRALDFGIDSTWNDNNEYEVWDDQARCQAFPIGLGRPIQTLLMMRASYEAQLAHHPRLRPFLISRSGCPGMQRYVQTWSGDNATDWKSLAYNIPMGLGLSLSGVPNCGHDVGGFYGPAPTPELLVRWVQNGVFQPRFCIHSWNTDGSVNEPWMYPEVLPIIRYWIEFRYRLIPYFYALLDRAVRLGEPLIRPMVYHFPHDPNCWNESFDYMLGPSLLVANVLHPGQRLRSVYLPQDTLWYDFFSGQAYRGGRTIELSAELDQVPLLARSGSMVALQGELRVFPCAQGQVRFQLREDDGVTLDGPCSYVEAVLDCSPQGLSLDLTWQGDYPPAYDRLTILLPPGEKRAWLGAGEAVLKEGWLHIEVPLRNHN